MGWRYLLFALGGMTLFLWAVRFFVFPLEESPRFLVGRGRDEEAVAVIQRIAKFNGRECGLTVDQLRAAGEAAVADADAKEGERKHRILSESSEFSVKHVKALFATPKLAWSTSLLIALWGMFSHEIEGPVADRAGAGIIGLASTLYNSFLPYL